jgi:hypothetical protein
MLVLVSQDCKRITGRKASIIGVNFHSVSLIHVIDNKVSYSYAYIYPSMGMDRTIALFVLPKIR